MVSRLMNAAMVKKTRSKRDSTFFSFLRSCPIAPEPPSVVRSVAIVYPLSRRGPWRPAVEM